METVEAMTFFFFSLEDLYQYGRLSEQLHVPYEECKPLQDISWGYMLLLQEMKSKSVKTLNSFGKFTCEHL